jgi:hypothetical protein
LPLSADQIKELELFDGRRWCINSRGLKHFCCRCVTGLPYLISEPKLRKKLETEPGLLVVPLPPQYAPYELLNGWVRPYKKNKGVEHALHCSCRRVE